ncbi:MAG: MarC family protein [Mucilaginibacter sp.]|nr:MarC family protein [Mucilaginibacter sp.]
MLSLESFIHLVFTAFIALFPVINPMGSAFIVSPYFEHLSRAEKRKAVGYITFYAFCVCTVALFGGHWILELFGISIPVVQLAGGIMICKIGWEFLSSDQGSDTTDDKVEVHAPVSAYEHLVKKLFYPITFPVTTGAGTISVLFTLSAHGEKFGTKEYYVNIAAVMVAIIALCILIYIFYLNTKTLINYLGSNGENIVNRISAF